MRHGFILLAVSAACVLAACRQHPLTDYRPLDQAGMWSDSVEQLKALNTSDSEVAQLVLVSGDLVTLRLIGLSDSTVQFLMQRKLSGQPTLSSGEISRLKNTGLSESWIIGQIKAGMTDAQADKVIALREAERAHANTGFVRVRGRRPR